MMTEYRVIKFFTDLKDGEHPYNIGDVYPREGKTATAERIAELASNANQQHTPLIQAVEIPDNAVENVETEKDTTENTVPKNGTEKPKKKGRGKNADRLTDDITDM